MHAGLMFSLTPPADETGTLKISFINIANGQRVVLRDSQYVNPFNETYMINKLRYYVSNTQVTGAEQLAEEDPYHLINAAEDHNSFELKLKPGKYQELQFLLGVDSIRNCSGAQTGGLDPTKDMFWTWNSGYVMFKLEGTSPNSTADLQRIEHHIGGYKAENNVATPIRLNFEEFGGVVVTSGKLTEVVIQMDLDKYWRDKTEIRISENPVWMTTGGFALQIARNFAALFSVKTVSLPE